MPFSSSSLIYNPAFPLDGIEQTEEIIDESDGSIYELCSQQSSSNDTASNLTGSGRMLGRLYSYLGRALERTIGRLAHQSGFGPKAVASRIKRVEFLGIRVSVGDRLEKEGHIRRVIQWTVKDGSEAKLRSDCEKLAKYATADIWDTRFEALVQIIQIVTAEPRLRSFFNTPSILLALKNVTQSSYMFSHGSADQEDELKGHERTKYLAEQALLAIEDNSLNDVIEDFLQILFIHEDSQVLEHIGYKNVITKLLEYRHNPRYSFIARFLKIRVLEFASNVAASLQSQFEQYRQNEGLDRAITLQRVVLELLPEDCPYCSMFQNNITASMRTRCMRHGRIEDLEEDINPDLATLDLRPERHPDRSASLRSLSAGLRKRYEHYGRMEDLEESIELARAALKRHPEGHPDRSITLYYLATSLSLRHLQYGRMEDLGEMIALARAALELHPKGHSYGSISLDYLANSLRIPHMLQGKIHDLEEMTKLIRGALELRSDGHLDSFTVLIELSTFLDMQYVQHVSMEDIEAATELDRPTLELWPQDHPDCPISLINVPPSLHVPHVQHGGTGDLEEMNELGRASTERFSKEHPGRFTCITILPFPLRIRYVQCKGMEDFRFEESIGLGRTTFEFHTEGLLDCAMSRTVLSAAPKTQRLVHYGGTEKLDKAIEFDQTNLKIFPKGHPGRSTSLLNLAAFFGTQYMLYIGMNASLTILSASVEMQYMQHGREETFEDRVELDQVVLQLCSGNPDCLTSLSNPAISLGTQYILSRKPEDLEKAIELNQGALQTSPQRPSMLSYLSLKPCSYTKNVINATWMDIQHQEGYQADSCCLQTLPRRTS